MLQQSDRASIVYMGHSARGALICTHSSSYSLYLEDDVPGAISDALTTTLTETVVLPRATFYSGYATFKKENLFYPQL